ncbi:MAG: SDR family NAD(P)-dependent oxidoreductase [Bryobacterales bacterium]|nr:SDR family NAD(P)-dependent oxidoreductase [Bryobacterales bacterium]
MISGGSEGVGAACARELLRRGASVSLTARTAEKLAKVAAEYPKERVFTLAGDITDAAHRQRWVSETLQHFKRIDILINNAGVGLYQPSHAADPEQVRRLFELNLLAPVDLVRLVTPGMKERGSGCIVNVGSIAGKATLPWLTLYSASKYALGSYTDGLRMELGRYGIHALIVCPGYVNTDFQQHILAGQVPSTVKSGKWFRIPAEQCARDIADGIERNKRTVVTPSTGWAFVLLQRLLPGRVEKHLAGLYYRGLPNA